MLTLDKVIIFVSDKDKSSSSRDEDDVFVFHEVIIFIRDEDESFSSLKKSLSLSLTKMIALSEDDIKKRAKNKKLEKGKKNGGREKPTRDGIGKEEQKGRREKSVEDSGRKGKKRKKPRGKIISFLNQGEMDNILLFLIYY